MMVFFWTRLGKILIWQNFSGTWESDFKKWGFPLQISSVNVTKSAGNWKTVENFFFVQCPFHKLSQIVTIALATFSSIDAWILQNWIVYFQSFELIIFIK